MDAAHFICRVAPHPRLLQSNPSGDTEITQDVSTLEDLSVVAKLSGNDD